MRRCRMAGASRRTRRCRATTRRSGARSRTAIPVASRGSSASRWCARTARSRAPAPGVARGDGRAYYREYGPDLTGLFIGDTGALGIKTAVSLHLVPRPGARATASFGYERFEDVAATFVELAPYDVFTRRFCFDPYDTANIARVRAAEAACGRGEDPAAVRAGVRQGVKDGMSLLKAGLGGGAKACWSINLVAEQFTQEAADAAIAAGARICLRRGRQIPNVTALAGATPIYSVRRFLGRDGERWIATNAIFPISRAVEVTRATEAFFAAQQAQLERHRVRDRLHLAGDARALADRTAVLLARRTRGAAPAASRGG
jgi:FAD/FMN-containing dehydrogenase